MRTQNKVLQTKGARDVRGATLMPPIFQAVNEMVDFSSEDGIRMYGGAYLSSKASSKVITNTTKGKVFCDVEIEGMRFQGYIGSAGPAIKNVVTEYHFWEGGSVPLGRATEIHYIDSFPESPIFYISDRKPGWWICKYGPGEPLINLNSLTAEGLHTLAFQFGIPIFPNDKAKPKVDVPVEWTFRRIFQLPDGLVLFFLSPSFKDLCAWAQSHPRQVCSSRFGDAYLRGWKNAAAKGEYVPNWRGWNGDSIKCV